MCRFVSLTTKRSASCKPCYLSCSFLWMSLLWAEVFILRFLLLRSAERSSFVSSALSLKDVCFSWNTSLADFVCPLETWIGNASSSWRELTFWVWIWLSIRAYFGVKCKLDSVSKLANRPLQISSISRFKAASGPANSFSKNASGLVCIKLFSRSSW